MDLTIRGIAIAFAIEPDLPSVRLFLSQMETPAARPQNLLTDRIWLGYPITEARVKSFLDGLDDTTAHAISYGTLDDAAEIVERAMA